MFQTPPPPHDHHHDHDHQSHIYIIITIIISNCSIFEIWHVMLSSGYFGSRALFIQSRCYLWKCSLTLELKNSHWTNVFTHIEKLIFEEKNSLWRKYGHSRWKKNTTTDIWEICSHWKKKLTLDKIWFYSYWRNLPTHIGACKTALTHWSLYFFCLFKFLPFWLRLLSRRHDHHDHHISFIKLLFQTWNLLFFASVVGGQRFCPTSKLETKRILRKLLDFVQKHIFLAHMGREGDSYETKSPMAGFLIFRMVWVVRRTQWLKC